MKKIIIMFLSVLVLSSVLSGCGGGGKKDDEGSGSERATYNLHFQDQNQAAMVGVVLHYTDLYGRSYNTVASDTSGNLTVVFTQAGSYPVNGATLSDGMVVNTPGMKFDISQSDINSNITKNFVVKINTSDPNNPIIDYDRQATYDFHFQDANSGAAMVGLVLHYTDLYGRSCNTVASDKNGNSTLTFDQSGTYPISGVSRNGTTVIIPNGVSAKFEVSNDEVNNNVTKKYLIKINTTSNPPELVSYDEVK
jgi:hypothetical protein